MATTSRALKPYPPVNFAFVDTSIVTAALLLDDVGVTAAGAFGLRKLRSAYAGSCLRLRRASDNAEQDIGFSGDDFDWAAAIAFKGASSVFVKTWYTQQGGADLTQATTGNQPELDTTNQEIKFDGVNDALTCTIDLSATNKASISMVLRIDPTQASFAAPVIHGSSNYIQIYGSASSTVHISANGGANNSDQNLSFASSTTAHRLVEIIMDRSLSAGNIVKGYYNASALPDLSTTTISGNLTNGTLSVGATGGFFLKGGTKELVLYPAALTAGQRAVSEANTNSEYTIY